MPCWSVAVTRRVACADGVLGTDNTDHARKTRQQIRDLEQLGYTITPAQTA